MTAGTKYLIRASYLEIYNENIRDLLAKDVKATLELKVGRSGIRPHCLVAAISPAHENYEETLSTLRCRSPSD